MTRIKFDINVMNYISVFESLTLSKVKDCIPGEETIIFIVAKNEISKAIGKGGCNIRKLNNLFKKKIKVVEFDEDIRKFIKNFSYPVKIKDINEVDDNIIIEVEDRKSKGMLIGRENQNLNKLKGIAKRYFKFNEIKVK